MSAGLILIAALAIVFIPRALQQEGKPPIPQVHLAVSSRSGTAWANVTSVTVAASLTKYNATVVRASGYSTATVGALAVLADRATDRSLAFRDVDGDGILSPGDSFRVTTVAGGTYSLYIWYTPEAKLVGIATWTG